MSLSRRHLLQAMAAAGLLPSMNLLSAAETKRRVMWRNWSGAQVCIPAERYAPNSEDELAEWIKRTNDTIRPVGSAHSFSPLVPTDGAILSLDRMAGMTCYDAANTTADFWGGTRLADMGAPLESVDQAMIQMPDIDYQTVAGAIATSTHGTGIQYGSLSKYVAGLRLVTANGDVVDCDAETNPELFAAARVSLGALGVVSRVRMQNRKAFRIHETMTVEKTEDLLDNIDALVADNQHWEMQVITHSDYAASISLNETDAPITSTGDEAEEGGNEYVTLIQKLDRYAGEMPSARTAVMNLIASLASFEERVSQSYKIFANVRNVRFNEMEYSVPAEHGPACLRDILKLIHDNNLPSWFPIEYRYIAGDDIPLSMFEGEPRCALSIHQYYEMDYHNFFAAIEPIFWKYNGRPHWGKLHNLNHAQLSGLYPRWKEFTELRSELDPDGKFLNGHLRTVFGDQ